MKVTAFWDITPCNFIEVHRRYARPDDGGSENFWNVGLLLRDYRTLYPRRLSSSYLSPWEPKSQLCCSHVTWNILIIQLCAAYPCLYVQVFASASYSHHPHFIFYCHCAIPSFVCVHLHLSLLNTSMFVQIALTTETRLAEGLTLKWRCTIKVV
jgi:hypothetical protein